MVSERAGVKDELQATAGFGRPSESHLGVKGIVTYTLLDADGNVKLHNTVENLVTRVGDQWYAERAAKVSGSAVTLTALSNATSCVATTSGAHGLGVGDPITIAGVTPSGYNGSWVVSAVSSSTSFTFYVGTALGAGTVFGTVTGLSLPGVTGMRLGTDTTAAAKTSTGSFIGTYTTASQHALDSVPASSLSGSSRRITYACTWAAGEATANSIAEVALTFESPLTNVAGTAANTIARALLSPTVNKGASDTLLISWTQDVLGA